MNRYTYILNTTQASITVNAETLGEAREVLEDLVENPDAWTFSHED